MPRAPITDFSDRLPETAAETAAEVTPIATGPAEYDDVLGVYSLFLVIPRAEVVYFRLVLESWEDIAVARTMERFYPDDREPQARTRPRRGMPTRSLVVALAVPDFIDTCARRLARLCAETGGVQVASTPELRGALRRDLLEPAATGSGG